MNQTLLLLITLAVVAEPAMAAAETFDFKDPKGVNNITFKIDAPLESTSGSGSGISGTVTFDPEQPAATKGTIVLATSSLQVPNPMMKQHMHGEQWMNVAKYPTIIFVAKELTNVKTAGNKTTADLAGALTVKGISRDITIPVTFTFLKDKLGQRVPNQQGDLLVIRSSFTIRRTDYDINPKAPEDKVSNDINITLSLAGAAPRS